MKYLKTYETNSYNIGDYLLINNVVAEDKSELRAKIFDIGDDVYPYNVYIEGGYEWWITDEDIIRELTEGEIEQWELEMTNKMHDTVRKSKDVTKMCKL